MTLKSFLFSILLVVLPGLATAQSPFSAAITINGIGITHYEIEQRARMLEALGMIGDPREQALNDLIDDRLRLQAGRAMGLLATEEELNQGFAEYAERAGLTPEQFLENLAAEGIEKETFADFIHAGITWRKVVVGRFQSKAFITEAELDTAMALGTIAVGASVLLAEIVLPLEVGAEDDIMELATELSTSIASFEEFEEAALTFSASPTRDNGGKMPDWIPAGNLPGNLGEELLKMRVGQVTPPIKIQGGIALFQLRGVRDNRTIVTRTIGLDYATLLLPGGRSEQTLARAAELAGSIDTCNDLLAKSTAYPEDYYSQQVVPVASVPRHIALELAKLDANEVSTALTEGENGEFLVFLMLCGRTNQISEGNREEVRNALFNQRLEAFAQGYLQELKGDAIIIEK